MLMMKSWSLISDSKPEIQLHGVIGTFLDFRAVTNNIHYHIGNNTYLNMKGQKRVKNNQSKINLYLIIWRRSGFS